MAREKLSLDAICRLGRGKIRAAFDRELQAALADCGNRPEDGKSRKIALVVDIAPAELARGEAETVDVDFQVKSSIPARKSIGNRMALICDGGEFEAVFNEESLDNPRQHTLDEALPEPIRLPASG